MTEGDLQDMGVSFDLDRFLMGQDLQSRPLAGADRADDLPEQPAEIVLPQFWSLGSDASARRFGLKGLDEAYAYWNHPILGNRLRHAIEASLVSGTKDPVSAIGEVNAKRFRSCLTLFLNVAPGDPLLTRALAWFFRGKPCRKTLAHLERSVR